MAKLLLWVVVGEIMNYLTSLHTFFSLFLLPPLYAFYCVVKGVGREPIGLIARRVFLAPGSGPAEAIVAHVDKLTALTLILDTGPEDLGTWIYSGFYWIMASFILGLILGPSLKPILNF